MMEITKLRMRRVYRWAIYGFALYGLMKSPFCSSKLEGKDIYQQPAAQELRLDQESIPKPGIAGGLEKITLRYKAMPEILKTEYVTR